MRILITGANGYIVSRLITPLLTAGHQVVAATRDPARLAPMGWFDDVTAVSLDASYPESARSAFAAAGPVDVVYYLGYHPLAGESGAHD